MKYFLLLLLCCAAAQAEQVSYQLDITQENITVDGESAAAMLVNNAYPGPVLRFRRGDTARITVTNHTQEPSSVHWHGLLVPPGQDGVPYLSYLPIGPGESFVYEFPLKHAGTYWYHSHTDLQEQSGVHGAIVVEAPEQSGLYDHEAVLVLQDWTHEQPGQVLANLKKDGDYYALRKDSVASIAGYSKRGKLRDWLQNRWDRMGGMDVSDVAYDAFLVNGQPEQVLFPDAQPGERIRLRLVNAGASTYFLLHSARLELEVVAADGLEVAPVVVDEVMHAVAETYDLLVTVPERGMAELRATAQDGTGYASIFVGSGERIPAPPMQPPDIYASHANHDMPAHAHHMQHRPRRLAYSDMQTIARDVDMPVGAYREIPLRLTGDMETYNWTFNDIPLSRADKLLVSRGEVVRFVFINETMMHHPLHLHGHFFRVLDAAGQGPMKHTVNVPPLATVTIEFAANEEKDWFFHCHNLYHAKTGMARVIRYDDYSGNSLFAAAKKSSTDIADDDYYLAGELKLLDDFVRLEGRVSNNRNQFEMQLESRDYMRGQGSASDRAEVTYRYRLDRWSQPFVGIEKEEGEDLEYKLGFSYVLPLLVEMDVFVTSEGDIEAEWETQLQLSTRMQLHGDYETTGRYHLGLEYRLEQRLSLELAYTSDVAFSVGGKWRF